MDVIVLPDRDGLVTQVTHDIVTVLARVLAERDAAQLCVTGGSVGIAVLTSLGMHAANALDWTRVHVWWSDERWVEAHSADRNDEQASPGFLRLLNFPPQNIHRMPAPHSGLTLDDAAREYESSLPMDDAGLPRFDVLLLGIGPDAHVASLFPRHEAADENDERLVIPVRNSPKPPPERVSFTLRALNSAERVWIIAAGADKAPAVLMAQGPPTFSDAPVSAVQGRCETRLYCDAEAASG